MSKAKQAKLKRDYCMYADCINSKSSEKTLESQDFPKLFYFPSGESNSKRQKQWMQNTGNRELLKLSQATIGRLGICALHFNSDDFSDSTKVSLRRNGNIVPIPHPSIYNLNDSDVFAVDESINKSNLSSVSPADTSESSHKRLRTIMEPREERLSIPRNKNVLCDINCECHENKLFLLHEKIEKQNNLIHELREENRKLKKSDYYHKQSKKNKEEDLIKFRPNMSQKTLFKKQSEAIASILDKMDISPAASALISLQLHRDNTEYTEEEKNISKMLYYYSANALTKLREVGCNFPSPSSMKRWV